MMRRRTVEEEFGDEDEALRCVRQVGRELLRLGPFKAVAEEASELLSNSLSDGAMRSLGGATLEDKLEDGLHERQGRSRESL